METSQNSLRRENNIRRLSKLDPSICLYDIVKDNIKVKQEQNRCKS